MPFISLLQAAPATSSGSLLMTVLPLALIFVIFYFFMIRPQNKKQKETEKMIAALKKGDKVITIGGIHGTVSSTKEKTVIVKVDDNTKIEFLRSAISTVVTDKAEKNGKKDTVEAVTAEAEKAIEEEKK
ncbi:MAG: preprotein translocase subunit YajC [Spirochaetaceae bacterium]|jgi:preprotein translocase subunit YajC|nr:preprotein translocase subunit YajC [Spirochaetaceae bacterium]